MNPQFSFLIPTRNNLAGLAKLFQSIVETTTELATVEVVLVVDEDDQESRAITHDRVQIKKVVVPKGYTMGELNNAAFESSSGRYIMLMNDDVILRTKNWDRICLEIFAGFKDDIGLIHVNDLLFRERLCTFPMLSRKACLAIGVCPKAYRRYRIDDHIYDTYNLLAHLGHKRIVYLPEVIFEHENHVAEGAPTEGHIFASEDKKVYVPKGGIIEADAKYCDERFDDRKKAALKLAEIIETEKHARILEQLRVGGVARLAVVSDSHSYRRPEYLRTQPTGVIRDTSNARTTIAVVTADLRGEVAQRCLAALKKHTANYDLVILDNNRGPNFSHSREMNKVLALAQTEFLVLLDDDVIVETGWLDGLLRCMDAETGVVVPMHKDAAGKISFSGAYLSGDGRGSHEHTIDQPDAPRPVQCYCSAAMLIDMRKCGHIFMDQAYSKYFFDLVHAFEVWEAGWKAVCCPDVIVTHIGGATVRWGSDEANALQEKDRATFIRAWIESGRLARLEGGIWRRHKHLTFLVGLPKRTTAFLACAHKLKERDFSAQLASLVTDCAQFNLLKHQLRAGLYELLPTFQKEGKVKKLQAYLEADLAIPDPRLERRYVISVANKLFETQQYELAEAFLLKALHRQPREIEFWRPLGYVRLKAGDLNGARESFEQALNFAPNDIESLGSLGGILFLSKRPTEAVGQYEKALALCCAQSTAHPRIAELTRNLAIARQAVTEAGTLKNKTASNFQPPSYRAKTPQSKEIARPVQGSQSAAERLFQQGIRCNGPLPEAISSEPACNSFGPGAKKTKQSVSASSATGSNATGRQKVLFVPLEFSERQHARHVSYAAQMGLAEGLRANGADVLTLPSVFGWPEAARNQWWKLVREICAGRTFHQVWVEVVHSKWSDDELAWFASLAPVRVGMIMESLAYEAEVSMQNPILAQRKDHVWQRLRNLTHVLTVDEADVEGLNRVSGLKALWWPQSVPSRFIGHLPAEAPSAQAVFGGMVYGERKAWLERPELKSLLQLMPSPEDATALPRIFDDINAAVCLVLTKGGTVPSQLLVRHAEILSRLRSESFRAWLRGLQQGSAVVNLPSLFQGYAGRVFEAMAAGRPVISWDVENRPLTRSLFEAEQEILLFSVSSHSQLAERIRRVQSDSGLARRLAENARQKLRQLHTLEWRVTQILDWIASGEQPDFGSVVASRFRKSLSASPRSSVLGFEPIQFDHANRALTNDLLCAFGRALSETRDAAEARECLRIVVSREPNHAEATVALAELALRENKLRDCRQWLDPVLVNRPCHLEALRVLAEFAHEGGLATEAESIWEIIARAHPNFPVKTSRPSLATQDGQSLSGIAPDLQAWIERRVEHALRNELKNQQPKNHCAVPVVADLGSLAQVQLLLKQGDLAAAWQAGMEAIRLRPFHPECFLILAEITQAAGDMTKARQCAEYASKLASNWKPARKFLKSLPAKPVLPKAELPALPSELTSPTPRLTVCLIARNEEQFVSACLNSVRDVAGQIVVVDTGSTDRTKEIAASCGAEVYSFEWIDDFSAARNAALERATGDWVLMLDADEQLTPASREILRKEMRDSKVMAYRLPIVDAGQEENGCNYVPRLFRNAPGIHFTGRIHEQAFGSLESKRKDWGLENRLSETTLIHHGYTKEMTRRREKVARNLRLLQWALEEQPGDINLLLNLGLELVRSDRRNDGIARYCEAFHLLSAHPAGGVAPELREALLTQLSTHLMAGRRFAEAAKVLQSALARAGGLTASMHLTLGLALMELKQFTGAAEEFRQCIAKRNHPALTPVDPNVRKAVPHHCLAQALAAQGRWEAAEKSFQTALEEDPLSILVRLDYARYLHKKGQSVQALSLLHQILANNGDAMEVWLLGGDIALSAPAFMDFANDWTSEAVKILPKNESVLRQRAQLLTLRGDSAHAISEWQKLAASSKPSDLAGLLLCQLCSGTALDSIPVTDEPTVSQEFLSSYRRLIDFGGESMLAVVNARLPALSQVLPTATATLEAILAEASELVAA